MTDIVRFKDFSTSPEPVVFEIKPDTFVCLPDIPFDVLADLATLGKTDGVVDPAAQLRRMHDFFDVILEPDSAAVFRQRTAKPTIDSPNPNPIGMKVILEVMQWLTEVYGLRPTQPSSESADGSSDDEASSTVGA